jgi:DNA-binding NarL/FixJ family response regulator
MGSSDPIRILIVEDHPVFRIGLSMIIAPQSDMKVVAQASNSREAVSNFAAHRPDVTLMDQRLPGLSGTDALTEIRAVFPQARVIILTTFEGDIEIQRALRAGAFAYVLKTTPQDELLAIIRSVHRGQKYIPQNVAGCMAEHFNDGELTPREIEVLKLITEGNRNKQIADKLSIAEATVNFHIRNLVDKLGAHDRAHAIAVAIRRGLLHIG